MHMADALVTPAVAATMYAASAAVACYSVKKVKLEQDEKKIPLMGIMGAFVFAAQMINFSIPGTGSSGHLCGGLLLSALVGPWAGFLTMIAILTIQCLMFADGGILALGCNVWNMAFYACFIGYFCVYRPIIGKKMSGKRIMAASVLGAVLGLQLGAFSVTLETSISGITELPFLAFLTVMQPIHLAIGIVEGFITGAMLNFIYKMRPELLDAGTAKSQISYKNLLIMLSALTVLIGGGLSLAASSSPDGLEWSIEKLTGSTEVETGENDTYDSAKEIQEKTAWLPDYQFFESESPMGTVFSGVIGVIVVAFICIGGFKLVRIFKKDGHSGT